MLERRFVSGFMRINWFHEKVENAIFNQTITVDGETVSTFLPIDETTTRGIEFIVQQDRLFDTHTDVRFNVTRMDSEITKYNSNPGLVGKQIPRMPEWRANLLLTWHLNKDWDTSGGLRYASDSYNRLDNSDTVDNVFGGMDGYTFIDIKAGYKVGKVGTVAFGIDNLTDESAFVYHPWPQRTYYVEGKLTF